MPLAELKGAWTGTVQLWLDPLGDVGVLARFLFSEDGAEALSTLHTRSFM